MNTADSVVFGPCRVAAFAVVSGALCRYHDMGLGRELSGGLHKDMSALCVCDYSYSIKECRRKQGQLQMCPGKIIVTKVEVYQVFVTSASGAT